MDSAAYDRLKHGDDQDIGLLYRQYRPGFVRYISKAFHSPASRSEELYPEAFSIVYFNIRNGKLIAPLRSTIQTYLNSTGWHLYHRRHLDKYHRDKIDLTYAEREPETGQLVEEAIIQQERATQVRNLLIRIGDPCRSLLTEIYLHETSYKDLAMNMQAPEATLRKRKFDCLEKMRRLLNELQLEW